LARSPEIGIDDDFVELGGTSLQALTVFLEIEARLGCTLSPTVLAQAPTIARLAKAIRTTASTIDASQSLVTLRTSGAGLPLFLVTSIFSLGTHYRHLVNDLKTNRPVFGLQPPPLDGKHRIPRTVESMAADYIIEIRRVQPHGPYFLAGHSFGGRVSFEIAQQLVREGERVNFLGLIDTVFRNTPAWVSEAARLGGRMRGVHGFQDLLLRGLGYIVTHLSYRIFDLRIRRGRPIPYKQRSNYYDWLRTRASRKYVHEPYPGHITVFSGAGNSRRHTAYWGPLARGGLTVLEVPAEHNHLVSSPHSKLLAEYFDSCLELCAADRSEHRQAVGAVRKG
jgi:oxalate---CoA ligase